MKSSNKKRGKRYLEQGHNDHLTVKIVETYPEEPKWQKTGECYKLSEYGIYPILGSLRAAAKVERSSDSAKEKKPVTLGTAIAKIVKLRGAASHLPVYPWTNPVST